MGIGLTRVHVNTVEPVICGAKEDALDLSIAPIGNAAQIAQKTWAFAPYARIKGPQLLAALRIDRA